MAARSGLAYRAMRISLVPSADPTPEGPGVGSGNETICACVYRARAHTLHVTKIMT